MNPRPIVAAIAGLASLATASAVLSASTVQLHPVEKYIVVYEYEGMQSGTSTQYNREWGHLRAEVQDTATTLMGMTVTTKQRMIVRDDEIVTIDLKTNTATKTRNPMYERLVASLQEEDLSAEELGRKMLRTMGGEPTGETGRFAGEACEWWRVQQVGQRICITKDAITLRLEMNLGGMSMIQTATSVLRNDGGPDSVFDYTGVPVQQAPAMPDLSAILGKPQPTPDREP